MQACSRTKVKVSGTKDLLLSHNLTFLIRVDMCSNASSNSS